MNKNQNLESGPLAITNFLKFESQTNRPLNSTF